MRVPNMAWWLCPAQPSLPSIDCLQGHAQSGTYPGRHCATYRPWFSPYTYFVCPDKGNRMEASGLHEWLRDEGRGDGWQDEEVGTESLCSSGSSLENACTLREAGRRARTDRITSRDILAACHGQLAPQNGYKCAACCRLYPTLHSLKSHIQGGSREGFSCGVYYRKLKALWGQEKMWPGERVLEGPGL